MKREWKPEPLQQFTERDFPFMGAVPVVSSDALELCRLASQAFGLSTEYADKRLKSARRIAVKNFPGSARGARESADAQLQQMDLPARGNRFVRSAKGSASGSSPERKSAARKRRPGATPAGVINC